VDLDEYEKGDPRDFTLFKRATLAEMARDIFYETPWGNVRPGWHIECATMSTRYLGEEFDIHTSGSDLIFPHNENEIAQCEAVSGKTPARYWVHSELVTVGGKKMSRSAGNAVTLRDILKLGYTGREVRYLLVSTHYRQPLSYSETKLEASRAALRRIDAFVWRLKRASSTAKAGPVASSADEMTAAFEAAMDADLNVPMALGAIFSMIRKVNPHLNRNEVSRDEAALILKALERIQPALAIFDFDTKDLEAEDPEVEALVRQREEARERKDYETADRLREELRKRGLAIEDTVYGTLYWVEA
jgi:cysteinyl-tRNA synthetase